MSFVRVGLGALVAAASLQWSVAQAASTKSDFSKQESPSNSSTKGQGMGRSASGEVKGIDSKALTLSDGQQFRLTDQTSFDKDGQKVSRDQIKPGDQIKASYEARNKLAYATKVEATSGTESQAAGAKGQGEGAASQGAANKGTGSMGKDSQGATDQGNKTQDQGSTAQDQSSQGTGSQDSSTGSSTGAQDSNTMDKSGQDSGSQDSTSTPPGQSDKTQ